MADELKRRAEDVVRKFIDLGDHYAEKVVAVNADGTPIGGGGEGGGEVALDAATLAALEEITVGTELPAAALLANGAAMPTTPMVGSVLLGMSGGQVWLVTINPPSLDAMPTDQNMLQTLGFGYVYNGATWDRARGDTEGAYVKVVKPNQVVGGTLTIANGASLSSTGGDANDGIIDLRKKSLVGIQMPAAWTAAALTFSASMDGGVTYNDLYDDTMTERSIAVVASRAITLDPTKFMGVTHLKFRSGTGAAAVNQGAARTINYTTIAL